MIITVVATLCHALAGIPAVCHEEIVTKDDMSIQACMLSQPALAEWKAHSIYAGEQWTIRGYKCVPGSYEPRDAI